MTDSHQLFVGSSDGHVHSLIFHPPFEGRSASLRVVHSVEAGVNPTWITFHPTERIAYVTDESDTHHPPPVPKPEPDPEIPTDQLPKEETPPPSIGQSAVFSFEIGSEGELRKVGTALTIGPGAVSSDVTPNGRTLAIAHYLGGTVSTFLTQPNGIVWPPSVKTNEKWTRTEPGPVADRQEASHPHSVHFDPTGRFLYSCDLGMDVVRVWKVKGSNQLDQLPNVDIPAGSGPRHVVWSRQPQPTHLYIVNELSNSVTVVKLSYPDAKQETGPSHEIVQSITTLPEGASDQSRAGEIAITPDGRFIFVTNRHSVASDVTDTIAVFNVGAGGELSLVRHHSTNGKELRHFSIHKSGHWLALAAQNSNWVAIFSLDPQTAELVEMTRVELPQPALAMWR